MDLGQSIRRLWGKQFLRFLAVGALNTAFGYSVFALGILIKLDYKVALAIATVCGVFFNFWTTGRLVFGSRDKGRLFKFVGAYVIMYGFNVALLKGVAWLGVPPLGGQALALPVVVLATYGLQKKFVFR